MIQGQDRKVVRDLAKRVAEVADAAAALPAEVLAAAQERGRARDLQATLAGLLAELEE